MINKVEDGTFIHDSIAQIPFLKRFLLEDYKTFQVPFDIKKINNYLGYEYLRYGDAATAKTINNILEEAEKRGDL